MSFGVLNRIFSVYFSLSYSGTRDSSLYRSGEFRFELAQIGSFTQITGVPETTWGKNITIKNYPLLGTSSIGFRLLFNLNRICRSKAVYDLKQIIKSEMTP